GHLGQLRYDTALAAGWPIATGAVEGACRHLIADLLDITGARWGLPGAEAVLNLRTVVANGDLTAYWRFHAVREQHRVHPSPDRNTYTLAA
ncbi:ISKra4 family transposase, partial [Streptomyces violascens]